MFNYKWPYSELDKREKQGGKAVVSVKLSDVRASD